MTLAEQLLVVSLLAGLGCFGLAASQEQLQRQRVEAVALDLCRQWMHATPVGMALCDPGNHSVVETSAAFFIFWARSPSGLIASPCQDPASSR